MHSKTLGSAYWKMSLFSGGFMGLVIASVMTFQDWRLNPGGLFRANNQTQWNVVWDTWISWFLPTVALTSIFGIGAALCLNWRSGSA